MAIEIVSFEDALWPGMSRFLHEHWQADHPLCRQDLFYWQYRGFGPQAGVSACRVAVDGERILGFLGAIPGVYRLDGQDTAGVALALWVVVEELRNSGLGMLLMREVEKQAPVAICLGVNPKVTRYYTATGYKHLPALHRYVCPLNAEGYSHLLGETQPSAQIEAWMEGLVRRFVEPATPRAIHAQELAGLWPRTQDRWRLALARTQEFWTWRYRDAVGFTYQQFGNAEQGAVVARLDRISSTDETDLAGKKVLRIIEILPAANETDVAGADATSRLLAGVLHWAREQGAVAGDFQCSSTRLGPWLHAAGLRRRSPEDRATHLPELFHPLRRGAAPINLMAKVKGYREIDFDAVYCVKSDGDMDRPVRWPE